MRTCSLPLRIIKLFSLFLLSGPVFTQWLPAVEVEVEVSDGDVYERSMDPRLIDSDGFLWLSLYPGGIGRYDGESMTTFGIEHGIDVHIASIAQDRKGYLWLGGHSTASVRGHLLRSSQPFINGQQLEDVTFTDSIPNLSLLDDQVDGLVTDPDGNLWASNHDSILIRYQLQDNDQVIADTISKNFKNLGVSSVAFDPDGRAYVLSLRTGKMYRLPAGFQAGEEIEIIKLPGRTLGRLIINDTGHLSWVSIDSIYTAPLPPPGKLDQLLQEYHSSQIGTTIGPLSFLDDSTVVVTNTDKLIVVDLYTAAVRAAYDHDDNLDIPSLLKALPDKAGNLWLGTVTGLARLPADFQAFATPNAASTGLAEAFSENSSFQSSTMGGPDNDWLIFGTTSGVILRSADNEWQHIGEAEGLPIPVVLGVAAEPGGRLWASNNRSGINLLTPQENLHDYSQANVSVNLLGKAYDVGYLPGLTAFFPYVVPLERETGGEAVSGLMLANSIFGILNTDDEPWYLIQGTTGIKTSMFTFYAKDALGRLLATNSQTGIYRSIEAFTYEYTRRLMANGKAASGNRPFVGSTDTAVFEHIPLLWEGIEYPAVTAAERYGDAFWTGITGGVLVLDITTLEVESYIPLGDSLRTPIDFEFDPARNRVWVATGVGLCEVDLAERRMLKLINEKQGLRGNVGNSPSCLAIDPEGVLYYVSSKGLGAYRPELASPSPDTFPVFVRAKNFSEDNWGKNELNLSYAALNFKEDNKRYQTKLEGYDEDWSESTKKNISRYTSLPAYIFPKTYQFRVRSAREDGSWIENSVPAEITVSPPWFFRWWAVLIGLGLLALTIRWFVHFQLRRQAEALALKEAAVIKEQRDEIKQKNDQNELLLKEIHHRVKNNLEVVSSLLELQSAGLTDSDARDAMQAGQSRVQSMGLLHQKLYQGDNLAAIEMKDYFQNLAASLLETYEAEERIKVNITMEPLELDVDTAVPLGLIVNELLTNTIKYAFSSAAALGGEGEAAGAVEVGLSKEGTDYLLRVKDSGSGKDFDAPATGTGFGTRLVDLLSRQLGGTLTEVNDGGLKTELRFNARAS